MNNNFAIFFDGRQAVKRASIFIGNYCFRSIHANGKRIGHMEVVLDDEHDQLVFCGYIKGYSNLSKIIDMLEAEGFSGLPFNICSYSDRECLFDEICEMEGIF